MKVRNLDISGTSTSIKTITSLQGLRGQYKSPGVTHLPDCSRIDPLISDMTDQIEPTELERSGTGLSSRFSKLTTKIFKSKPKRSHEVDDEDDGEELDPNSIAGGGHSNRRTDITQHGLNVSSALQAFLANEGLVHLGDTAALNALIDKPHISVPPEVTDRGHLLPEYWVSSSHNTYLLGHQLKGSSCTSAYEKALNAGSRCVEIDAWDNPNNLDEPKVTHGYTLVSNISFRSVCETIRDIIDQEASAPGTDGGSLAAPIMLSLENHCSDHGQRRLVSIMKEVFGTHLLDAPLSHIEDPDAHVTLRDLGSKVIVIVEYHLPDEASDSESSSSSSSSEDEDEKKARHDFKEQKKAAPPTIIIPELAELGVYAQSVKPANDSWYTASLINGPHHHLINVSETGLAKPMASSSATAIARHNANHLMRVYPKGTRISSRNLPPVGFWALGAQICALNWQTFGASMQLNEALFAGTDGYVLKPAPLRVGGSGIISTGVKKTLRLRVAGATGVPIPADRNPEEIKPYVTCTLYQPRNTDSGGLVVDKIKRKTGVYKQHKKLAFLGLAGGEDKNPPPVDPVWDETLEWEYEDSELVFVRMLVKSDDSFASNPVFAVGAVRLMYVTEGWSFVRLLDLKGRETKCSLLVKFEVKDA